MSIKRISAINELKAMVNQFPEYTLSEILFTVCRQATFAHGEGKLSDLLFITDDQLYTAIEDSVQKETA